MNPSVRRFVSNDFTVRASCVDATSVVLHMQNLQSMQPIPTIAVGRSMVGALLMASHLKDGQEVGILVKGNGPIMTVFAQANYNGGVRGYTSAPQYEPFEYEQNNLSIKEAIGNGFITVARHQPFQAQPYQGTVELVSGEIGDDLAYYLQQSQQIRSILSLGVYLDAFGKVRAAGGILIEVMPGVEDEIVKKLEDNFSKNKKDLSQVIKEGLTPEDLLKKYMEGLNYTDIPHQFPISYSCPCDKARVLNAVSILGVDELDDMISKNEKAKVQCQMCGQPYEIEIQELTEIRNKLFKNSLH